MTDEVLTSAVEALAQVPVSVRWRDVERRLAGDGPAPSPGPDPGRPSGRRHDRRRVAAALAAAATVAVGLIMVWWSDSSPEPVSTGPGPAETASSAPVSRPDTSPDASSPATTGPATRSFRTSPVTAYTGSEYLVWAGEAGDNDVSQRADGFAVNVETGTVRPIPAAPIDPRSGATGVWTGTELIVCCGTGQSDGFDADTRSAAAWDPATGQWRILARPPASVARSFPASVWTGELMIVMARGPAVATYDPSTDRWTEVATPPAIDRHPEAIWTGAEVILWDARYGSGRTPPDDAVADRGWRWAPGRAAWEALPDLPPASRTQLGSIGWTGTEIVVWGLSTGTDGIGVGASWRPGDDEWRPLSPSPQGRVDAYDGTPGSQSVVSHPDERRILVRGLEGGYDVPPLMAYAPATDTWTVSDITVPGYNPDLTVANARLLVPDQSNPIAGQAPT